MQHDLAKSAKLHKQKLANQNNHHTASKKLIFLTLILAAGLVAFLIYLIKVAPQFTGDTATNITPKELASTKVITTVSIKRKKSEFEFYTLLPESEMTAPHVESYKSTSKKLNKNTSYLLQAGSFRKMADADRLRASLLLQGLDAKITKITNKNGVIWHRITVGPFNSRAKLNKAQDILAASNTESLLIRK